jgi:hypothetical protein
MREHIDLSFQFKGSRTYVHGTDIFNAIVGHITKAFNNVKHISVTFHNIIRSQVDCTIIKTSDLTDNEADCQIRFESNGTEHIVVIKSNDIEITGSYPYPENKIVELCKIEDKTITLEESIDYTNIEKIVAMNKALMEFIFSDAEGKWYFSKLTIDTDFESGTYSKYSLTLIKNMGLKLTKTAIRLNDKLIGYIYFSLV